MRVRWYKMVTICRMVYEFSVGIKWSQYAEGFMRFRWTKIVTICRMVYKFSVGIKWSQYAEWFISFPLV